MKGYPYFLADMADRKNRRTYHGDDKLVYIFCFVISKARFLKWCKCGVNLNSYHNGWRTDIRYIATLWFFGI